MSLIPTICENLLSVIHFLLILLFMSICFCRERSSMDVSAVIEATCYVFLAVVHLINVCR